MIEKIMQVTNDWLQRFIIKYDICPFAAPVFKKKQIAIQVVDEKEYEAVYQDILNYIDFFLTDERSQETALLVIPYGFDVFDDLLELQVELTEALQYVALDQLIQLVPFHPFYCFADSSSDDKANHTNRSPYPMLHILRHSSIDRLNLDSERLQQIPQRNMALLRAMKDKDFEDFKR